jgi:hypothetical protein
MPVQIGVTAPLRADRTFTRAERSGKRPDSWPVRHAAPRIVNKDEVEGGVLLGRKGR